MFEAKKITQVSENADCLLSCCHKFISIGKLKETNHACHSGCCEQGEIGAVRERLGDWAGLDPLNVCFSIPIHKTHYVHKKFSQK